MLHAIIGVVMQLVAALTCFLRLAVGELSAHVGDVAFT